MDDLISRQALLNDIEELKQSPWFNDDNYFAIRKDALSCVVELCVKKAPSVDAVEVVRCKDCKWWKKWARTCAWYSYSHIMIHADDYCSHGERKTDE